MEFRLFEQGKCENHCRLRRYLTRPSELWHNTLKQFKGFALVALSAQVKPQNSTERAAIRWVRSSGRISFRDFFQGFCGPHLESGWRLRPFFLSHVLSLIER